MPNCTDQPLLGPRFDDALVYASAKHRTQLRKGTSIPYFSHPLAVSSLVLEHGGNEDEAIAGLLHDVIEDCGVTAAELRERFGPVVADIVVGCTDSEPGEDRSPATWLPRKLKYVEHLAYASPPVRLVSFCDKLHNARAILADYVAHGDELWNRFNAGKDDQLGYYGALARTAKGRVPERLSGALNAVVGEIAERAAGSRLRPQ